MVDKYHLEIEKQLLAVQTALSANIAAIRGYIVSMDSDDIA